MQLSDKGSQIASTCLLLMIIGGAAFVAYSVRIPAATGETSSSTLESGGGSQTSSTSSGSYTQSESEGSSTFTNYSESEGGSTTTQTEAQGLMAALVPVNGSLPGVPSGYKVGNGSAELQAGEGGLDIHLHLVGMNPSTIYSLVLSINGTTRTVGNFSSAYDGETEFEASVPLQPGAYSVGLSVSDVSTLSAGFEVLVSVPAALQMSVAQYSGGESEPSSEAINSQTLGEGEQEQIDSAIRNNTIPFVVQVEGERVDFSVTDRNFTIFAGTLGTTGVQISVSGSSSSSPRVLLVNLTNAQAFNLNSGTLLVKYDGLKVAQASSLSQVFAVKPTDAPTFVVVTTASGSQLFVSIPHFSSHIIQILQALIQSAANALAIDWPILAVSLSVVTLAFATIYARRTKLYV